MGIRPAEEAFLVYGDPRTITIAVWVITSPVPMAPPNKKKTLEDELEDDWKSIRPNLTGGTGFARHLVGKFYGYLEVINREGSNKHGASLWMCLCRLCGNSKVFSRAALTSGRVKSCGCLKASLKGKPKPKPVDPERAPKRGKKTAWARILDD